MRCLLRHRWVTYEQIGLVVTQRCTRCWRTRTRVLSAPTAPDHPKESR